MNLFQVEHSNTGVDRHHTIPSLPSSGVYPRLADHNIVEAPTSLGISMPYPQPIVPSEGNLYNKGDYTLGGAWNTATIREWVSLRLEVLKSRRSRAMQDIGRLAVDCRNDNWDGEGADRVSPETVRIARSFAEQLPAKALHEDLHVDATPRGSICFEWVPRDYVMLDIGILSTGEIGYAYLIHEDEGSGKEQWKGALPESVLNAINRVFESEVTR